MVKKTTLRNTLNKRAQRKRDKANGIIEYTIKAHFTYGPKMVEKAKARLHEYLEELKDKELLR